MDPRIENTVIFSTNDSMYFAERIAEQLGLKVSKTLTHVFGGGEMYYRLGLKERDELFGRNVIFVGSTHEDKDINELYRVGCALAQFGTRQRIFVMPFFGYSTMERAKEPGEIVTAKVIARQLSSIPNSSRGNVFLMLDLHVSGLVHYFEGDCTRYELYAEKKLTEVIRKIVNSSSVIASADLGRARWVSTFAKIFLTPIVLIDKGRVFDETEVLAVIGDVEGKDVIIYDDMTRSASTIIKGAIAYLNHGARKIYVVLSHLALNDEGVVQKLIEAPIEKIISTNSHPMSRHPLVLASSKFEIVDISGEFIPMIKKLILPYVQEVAS